MKIMMALTSLDIGEMQTQVVQLAKQLAKSGNKVMVVAGRGAYVPELEKNGIKFYDAPLNKGTLGGMKDAYIKLRKAILFEMPDVVHAHEKLPALFCSLINKSVRFSLVTTAHDICLAKAFSRWGDATLAVSADVKKHLLSNYKLDSNNIIISPYGVDTDKFSPDKDYGDIADRLQLNPDAKTIVCMADSKQNEGAPLLKVFEIFEEIDKKVPGTQLVVVGEGQSFVEVSVKATEINNRLQRRAIIIASGATNTAKFISVADLCIAGRTNAIECLSMKKPVIVTTQQGYIGLFDEVKHEICEATNFTCRGQLAINNERFIEDIVKALEFDEEKINELKEYGRRMVLARYSLEKVANDNLSLYNMGINKEKCDIVILGYYGFRNSGDDSLLQAMVESMRKIKPDVAINVFSRNPSETKRHYGVEATYRYNIAKMFKTIKNCRLFVLGGGSIIQDVTSTKSLLYYLWFVRYAKKHDKKVMLYANGIGPVIKKSNRKITSRILNSVDCITLREDDSVTELKKLGVDVPKIFLTADPTFAINETNNLAATDLLEKVGIKADEKYVCISVRKWKKAPENFNELCAKMADYIAEKYNMTPLFVPMQYPYDASVGRNIVLSMKRKGAFISSRLDLKTLLGIVEKSSLVIAVRLHILIYATVKAVPCIGIAYDPKVSNFQKYIGQPYYLDPRALAAGDYKALIDECMANLDGIKATLEEKVDGFKEKANDNARIAINMLEGKNENSLR